MSENPYEQAPAEESAARPRHVLVLANETVAGRTLLEAIEERAAEGPIRVTVVSPQNDPRAGYVVYEDSRRSSADRRLRRTLDLLHEAGIAARGALDPATFAKVREALLQIRGPAYAELLKRLYEIDGFAPAEDREYDPVRAAIELLGVRPR